MNARDPDAVVIIGAGPAGLAVAACLTRAGVPFTLVDRATDVASAWRTHYARLHLHTAKRYSQLPHHPMPAAYPTYPSRAQVVAYLEDYAAHFGLRPRLGLRVTSAAYRDGRWRLTTEPGPAGQPLSARRLVIATGYNRAPFTPAFPGDATFPGERVHSARYGDGARFAGRDVLVIGVGNSGAEIAIDLWEHGARPTLAVRSPIHVVPRDLLGRPVQQTAILLRRLPARLVDRLTLPLARAAIGDLSPWGIHRPDVGPREQIERHGRVPLIDVGTVALIKQGAIGVAPGVARFDADAVTFSDGSTRRFDAIVYATGYRAALADYLEAARAVTDARGYPTTHGREAAIPGLYFCGFRNPPTGALREIALEAERIAADIARLEAARG